jgi:hypothetical protein
LGKFNGQDEGNQDGANWKEKKVGCFPIVGNKPLFTTLWHPQNQNIHFLVFWDILKTRKRQEKCLANNHIQHDPPYQVWWCWLVQQNIEKNAKINETKWKQNSKSQRKIMKNPNKKRKKIERKTNG